MSTTLTTVCRVIPIGAEIQPGGGVHFRVWAPERTSVEVIREDGVVLGALEKDERGYFDGLLTEAGLDTRYKYRLDHGKDFPDPASRFQPEGPHGFSQVCATQDFSWSDGSWRGVALRGQVLYELHIGTFTVEGTWRSAQKKLSYLRDTGITVIELMPVSDFPGRFGWGYDGVLPYAPVALYGGPDDMRQFVDAAHGLGIGVILDVVYNHLGPDGQYLPEFSPFYFSDRYKTEWGEAFNFDGEHSEPVREFILANAAYWVREFHLDGLRLDATQDIHDSSEPHLLAEISRTVKEAAENRATIIVGENEPQETRLIRAVSEGGYGLEALWNDDFHHTAIVALTGRSEAYYTDYRGTAQELLSCAKFGYLYQGQYYRWQKKRRGTSSLATPKPAMITFLQNHDQIANSARGLRIHEQAAPGTLKALTALMLLGPGTPMLFQGQEFAASSRFLYFADHRTELARMVKAGRAKFLHQWPGLRLPEMQTCFDDPGADRTFERCRLRHEEVTEHAEVYALHRDLLRIRKHDPVISRQGEDGLDGAVLSPSCFALRFFSAEHKDDRLLLINLGSDLEFQPAPEPLLAPPADKEWSKLWSSEDPGYGGCGTAQVEVSEQWYVPGQAAVLLSPAWSSNLDWQHP